MASLTQTHLKKILADSEKNDQLLLEIIAGNTDKKLLERVQSARLSMLNASVQLNIVYSQVLKK